MPGNANPIFSKVARCEWANAVTAANTALDGTGAVNIVFNADLTNGSYLQKLIIRPKGTNVATVMRVFMNNGGANTTATNNTLIGEITLPATTASAVAALAGPELPMNIVLPPGYDIFVTLGTAVAGGYAVTAVGGDY